MKNFSYLVLLLMATALLSCSSSKGKKGQVNILPKENIEKNWEFLFDGKSLDNWKKFKGVGVTGWEIKNGELYNSGVGSDHGGDIITKKEYENFELYVEWKISPESNSGIFYHVQEGVTNAIYESGPEYQLIDDRGWPTKLLESQYTGANYAMQAPVNAKVVAVGKWNITRIVVKNPHVEHWLNGKKVVEYDLWSDKWKSQKDAGKWKNAPFYGMAKKGHIGLQDHGGQTVFRIIKIRNL